MADKPLNRVIIDGKDMYEAFGLVLEDDYTIGIPDYKRYTVDLLGDGVVDLTSAGGDVYFQERPITLPMFIPDYCSQADFELKKSQIASWANGRQADIQFHLDPGFTYSGRVRSVDFERRTNTFCATFVVDAKPYKTLGNVVFRANAAGGVRLLLDNGRARTQPTIEVYQDAVLGFEGMHWNLTAGTWEIEDFWLHEGQNVVTINTTPGYGNTELNEYGDATLADIADKLLSELAEGTNPLQTPMTLSDVATLCSDLLAANGEGTETEGALPSVLWPIEGTRLIDLAYPEDKEIQGDLGNTNVFFEYEWRDL